jgi:hypothetical protein
MALSVPRTYAELLRRVQATLFAGQRDRIRVGADLS